MSIEDQNLFGPLTPAKKWEAPPVPELPAHGFLLVQRVGQKFIRITRPDGTFNSMIWVPNAAFNLMLKNEGIPESKWDTLLGHVWSFRQAYVSIAEDGTAYESLDHMLDVAGL